MVKTEVRVKELPFDEVEYCSDGRVRSVTNYSFEGLKVVVETYLPVKGATPFFDYYNCLKEIDGKSQGISTEINYGDLPEKVRKLFDAGTRENIEKMVRDGEFIRVRLE